MNMFDELTKPVQPEDKSKPDPIVDMAKQEGEGDDNDWGMDDDIVIDDIAVE